MDVTVIYGGVMLVAASPPSSGPGSARLRQIRGGSVSAQAVIYEEIVIYAPPVVPAARFAKHERAIALRAATSITPG
jgi:hypothetical protein